MQVNLNVGQRNPFFNVERVNQGIAARTTVPGRNAKEERRDITSISPQGRAMSIIEELTKQKRNISEQKNKLIGETLESGGTLEMIEGQLASYEDRLKSIDEQIAGIRAQQAADAQAEREKKTEDQKESPKTEEEAQSAQMAGLASAAMNLEQAQELSALQSKMEGDADILESEIEMDKITERGKVTPSDATTEAISAKEFDLAEQRQRAAGLTARITEQLADATEEAKAEEVEEENKAAEAKAAE